MNHGSILVLLYRLRDASDGDRLLAIAYLTFIGDRLVRLQSNHLAKYKLYQLDLAPFWGRAFDAAVDYALAVTSKSDTDRLINRITAIWDLWRVEFKAYLGIANIPQDKQLIGEIDDLVDALSVVRSRTIGLSDDGEKCQFASLLASLPV